MLYRYPLRSLGPTPMSPPQLLLFIYCVCLQYFQCLFFWYFIASHKYKIQIYVVSLHKVVAPYVHCDSLFSLNNEPWNVHYVVRTW